MNKKISLSQSSQSVDNTIFILLPTAGLAVSEGGLSTSQD